MKNTLSSRNAINRVIAICEVLAAANTKVSDRAIQNAAVDLHDIEEACRKGSSAISELRRLNPKGKNKTREMLIGIDIGVLEEIVGHALSLRKFFREIGIRDYSPQRKTRKKQ